MKRYKKVLLFIFIITLGLFLNKKYELNSYFKDINNLKSIYVFVDENYVSSVLLYLIFTIIGSSILALPGVIFAIIASGLFGTWKGSFYCIIGTSIGAVLSFLLSRFLLKDFIEKLLRKNKKLYDIIFKVNSQNEILILMITRLLPIFPFNLQNFAYGITNISIAKYSIGTFLFMIPGILVFSIGTQGIINDEVGKGSLLVGLFTIIFMLAAGLYLYKRYKLLRAKEQ